jgi:hypothetical protein
VLYILKTCLVVMRRWWYNLYSNYELGHGISSVGPQYSSLIGSLSAKCHNLKVRVLLSQIGNFPGRPKPFAQMASVSCHPPSTMASPPLAAPVPKDSQLSPTPPSSSSLLSAFAPITNVYNRLATWRKALDLPQPGTIENIQKEVRSALCFSFVSCAACKADKHVHVLTDVSIFFLLSVSVNVTACACVTTPCWHCRHPPDKLFLRWCSCGPDKGDVDEPNVPGHPLVCTGLSNGAVVVQFWRGIRV